MPVAGVVTAAIEPLITVASLPPVAVCEAVATVKLAGIGVAAPLAMLAVAVAVGVKPPTPVPAASERA